MKAPALGAQPAPGPGGGKDPDHVPGLGSKSHVGCANRSASTAGGKSLTGAASSLLLLGNAVLVWENSNWHLLMGLPAYGDAVVGFLLISVIRPQK